MKDLVTMNAEPTEETVSTEDLLAGKTQIPIGQIFPFLFEFITDKYEKQLGVSSLLDRNFLFLQQLVTRERISKLKDFQCLQPLISPNSKGPLAVAAIQHHDHVLGLHNELQKQNTFSLFYLTPVRKETPLDLLGLHELFQDKIREKMSKAMNFSHILKALYQCMKNNHFFFNVVEESEEKHNWTFHYDDGDIFIYFVPNVPPQPHIEKQITCRWITVDEPIHERTVQSAYHVHLSQLEIQSILEDKDAKMEDDEVKPSGEDESKEAMEEVCESCSA